MAFFFSFLFLYRLNYCTIALHQSILNLDLFCCKVTIHQICRHQKNNKANRSRHLIDKLMSLSVKQITFIQYFSRSAVKVLFWLTKIKKSNNLHYTALSYLSLHCVPSFNNMSWSIQFFYNHMRYIIQITADLSKTQNTSMRIYRIWEAENVQSCHWPDDTLGFSELGLFTLLRGQCVWL